MISSQFFQSLLRISIEIGEPSVSPARTPDRNSMRSVSICMRRPRPYPCCRRARSVSTSAASKGTPAGRPSRIETSAGPWDSPAVVKRSMNVRSRREGRPVVPGPVSQRMTRGGAAGALRHMNVPSGGGTNAPRPRGNCLGAVRLSASINCVPRRYWQLVVKLSGNATTVTPRIVAPTSTSWPFGRVVARTGPMIGSRIGIEAILR